MEKYFIVIISIFVLFFSINLIECKERTSRQFQLQSKETNVPNFVRLVVMRLIFGIAQSMGLGERLSGFLGGIFVPPGAEDYDDYGDDYGGIGLDTDDLF